MSVVLCLAAQVCLTLCNLMDSSPPGSSVLGDSPGKNSGLGCHALLQGIFPTQGFNPGLQHCRWILCHLSHQGSPRILEWVAYPFSSGSSWPRNWTGVSSIAGRFFTSWASREAQAVSVQNIANSISSKNSPQLSFNIFYFWTCLILSVSLYVLITYLHHFVSDYIFPWGKVMQVCFTLDWNW